MRTFKISVLFFLVAFQSCMLPGKMDKTIAGYYALKSSQTSAIDKRIVILSPNPGRKIIGYSASRLESFYTVPLIIYNYSKESMVCTLNSNIYMNTVGGELSRQIGADSISKLSNKIVELNFEKIPNTFRHRYTSHFVGIQLIIGIYVSFVKNEMFSPVDKIKVKYTIKEENTFTVLKEGYLEEPVQNMYLKNIRGTSRKKFIKDFVTSYDQSITEHCKTLSQKLIKEL